MSFYGTVAKFNNALVSIMII